MDDRNNDGIFDRLTLDSWGLPGTPPSLYNQRSAIEFNFGSLPSGVSIDSVTLQASINGTTGEADQTNILDFGVYAGDGTMELADATASSTIAGNLVIVGTDWPFHSPNVSIPIDAGSVQNAFLTSNWVGLNIWFDPSGTGLGADLLGLDSPNSYWKPALSITYSPEPSCLAAALFFAAMRRRYRRAT